ncbi:DUF4175 family protein [Flavobacterium sp. N2270]|uniref:DUF4175 family protein n=1 Tax=Flavobacterium sp. N2270 TaxID=2986831 RepID=UPI0022242C92|nr:DUF4175 family protein [Flavobacterium sp. N2270]
MEAKNTIYNKLEDFIKKFYYNELIKGSILFLGIGLLYFIATLLAEHFLWLSTFGRSFLFGIFILFELFLLFRFILFPIFKLVKLQKGLNYFDASQIIGTHFTEVKDKLLNFLQLANQDNPSELLLASIDQKANTLQPVPFSNAINYSKNKKFLPYLIAPIVLIFLFIFSGNLTILSNSFDRVVHFTKQYESPAPFKFVVLNKELNVKQNQNFTLQVSTVGKIAPENISVIINDASYFLEEVKPGLFQYTFENVNKNIAFSLEANDVSSQNYTLNVIDVPSIQSFKMILNFPKYLNRKQEIVSGLGNAIVPEGTVVNWQIQTASTSRIDFVTQQTASFNKNENTFSLQRKINSNLDYAIVTSNKTIKNYEKLEYQITVSKDQFPTITTQLAPDSLKLKSKIIVGQVADDFGLSKLYVVYYPKGNASQTKKGVLPIKNGTVDQFIYSFPNGLSLDKGLEYEYYFEVFDNDAVNGLKSSKSSVYLHYELTNSQKEDKQLKEQQENINSLEKSLKNQDKQFSEMDKLEKLNKEKSQLDFKDQKKIDQFLEKQKKQDEMMKEFSKNLSKNLEEFKSTDKEKEELIRRLEETQKQSERNEKLLKELEELSKKLQKEELFEKADKLKQNSKNQSKNLEQLVELTKRFYVEKKAEQIADKLNELAKKENKLSDDKQNNTSEKQAEIYKEFKELSKELEELNKQNEELKSPLEIPDTKAEEKSVEEDLNKAKEKLDNKNLDGAKPKQKSAAKKMEEMSQSMSASMQGAEMEQMEEDAKALRQILDNLLTFSFDEETLITTTKETQSRSLQFNRILKKQQELKNQFKHIDDSLFAVSLRNPMISEIVLNEIGEIHYNLDKTLETLADNNIQKGASHQQYVLSSANKLADFLSNVQNQMQMQMSGQGQGKPKKGKGSGMQLPDIIKKQEGLGEKMKDGMKPGEKEGQGKKPGEKGKEGESGKGSEEGENGSVGNAGKVLEILKEQQQLREALQNELNKQGMSGVGQSALDKMKEIEKQLINKGFKNETLQKMLNLKHELLKLEKAIQQQGEDTKRKSNTNKDDFNGTTTPISEELKEYLNSIEILNRQSLPLQPNFNNKVQHYFKHND